MKPTSKQMMIVALSAGIGLIVFAILNANFNFGLDPKLESDISTYGMLAGFAALMWSRKLRKEENEAASKAETPENPEPPKIGEPPETR